MDKIVKSVISGLRSDADSMDKIAGGGLHGWASRLRDYANYLEDHLRHLDELEQWLPIMLDDECLDSIDRGEDWVPTTPGYDENKT